MLGLGVALNKAATQVASGLRYVRDNLKLYMPFKTSHEVKFVGTGSTSFDGNDYISVAAMSLTGEFTVSCWMQPDNLTTRTVMGDDNISWVRFESTTTFKVKTPSGDTGIWTHGLTFVLDEWQHFIITRDVNNIMTIYRNGIAGGTTKTLAGTFTPKYIGQEDSSAYWDGSMKNVGIWERALSQTEIQNVMYKTYGQLAGTEKTSLVNWWALDATNLGTEVVTNGTFTGLADGYDPTGLDGWEPYTDANETRTISSERMKLVTTSGNAGIQLQRNLTSGATYQFSCTVAGDLGAAGVYNGTFGNKDTSSGSVSTTFTAGGGTTIIYLRTSSNAAGTTYYDDVSLRPVEIEDLHGSNDGSIYGATIDTDLYGGDTPKIPRAVDNAPTARADMIGNGSASFDTTDDYLIMGDSADWDFGTGSWSVTAWVKITEDIDQYFIGRWAAADSPASARHWGIYFHASTNKFEYVPDNTGGESGGQVASGTSNSVTLNEWAHLAYTRTSGGKGRIYTDGVLQSTTGSNDTQNHSNTDPLIIGNGQDIWGACNMAQIGIWSAALTQAQIQEVKEKSFAELSASDKTNLVSYWTLDEVSLAHGRTPTETNARDETAPQAGAGSLVLDEVNPSVTYTEILSSTTFTSQGDWVVTGGLGGGAGDPDSTMSFGNTEVYPEGALKIKRGYTHLATNGSGFSTALVSGSLYKIEFVWTVVDTSHVQDFFFGIDSNFGSYGLWRRYGYNTDDTPEPEQTVTFYHRHGADGDDGNYFYFRGGSGLQEFHIKSVSCKLITTSGNIGLLQ